MSVTLQDGTGTGRNVKVNLQNRLETSAVQIDRLSDVSERDGEAYEFATGAFITLANDTNEHAIFYVKNTSSTKHLHIDAVRTCGTAITKWIMYKNDTGGDLISDQNAGTEVNLDFSSAKVAEADVWAASGASKTRSGGVQMSQHIDGVGHSSLDFKGGLILGTNDSITFTATLESAAAGQEVCVRIAGYYEENV